MAVTEDHGGSMCSTELSRVNLAQGAGRWAQLVGAPRIHARQH